MLEYRMLNEIYCLVSTINFVFGHKLCPKQQKMRYEKKKSDDDYI